MVEGDTKRRSSINFGKLLASPAAKFRNRRRSGTEQPEPSTAANTATSPTPSGRGDGKKSPRGDMRKRPNRRRGRESTLSENDQIVSPKGEKTTIKRNASGPLVMLRNRFFSPTKGKKRQLQPLPQIPPPKDARELSVSFRVATLSDDGDSSQKQSQTPNALNPPSLSDVSTQETQSSRTYGTIGHDSSATSKLSPAASPINRNYPAYLAEQDGEAARFPLAAYSAVSLSTKIRIGEQKIKQRGSINSRSPRTIGKEPVPLRSIPLPQRSRSGDSLSLAEKLEIGHQLMESKRAPSVPPHVRSASHSNSNSSRRSRTVGEEDDRSRSVDPRDLMHALQKEKNRSGHSRDRSQHSPSVRSNRLYQHQDEYTVSLSPSTRSRKSVASSHRRSETTQTRRRHGDKSRSRSTTPDYSIASQESSRKGSRESRTSPSGRRATDRRSPGTRSHTQNRHDHSSKHSRRGSSLPSGHSPTGKGRHGSNREHASENERPRRAHSADASIKLSDHTQDTKAKSPRSPHKKVSKGQRAKSKERPNPNPREDPAQKRRSRSQDQHDEQRSRHVQRYYSTDDESVEERMVLKHDLSPFSKKTKGLTEGQTTDMKEFMDELAMSDALPVGLPREPPYIDTTTPKVENRKTRKLVSKAQLEKQQEKGNDASFQSLVSPTGRRQALGRSSTSGDEHSGATMMSPNTRRQARLLQIERTLREQEHTEQSPQESRRSPSQERRSSKSPSRRSPSRSHRNREGERTKTARRHSNDHERDKEKRNTRQDGQRRHQSPSNTRKDNSEIETTSPRRTRKPVEMNAPVTPGKKRDTGKPPMPSHNLTPAHYDKVNKMAAKEFTSPFGESSGSKHSAARSSTSPSPSRHNTSTPTSMDSSSSKKTTLKNHLRHLEEQNKSNASMRSHRSGSVGAKSARSYNRSSRSRERSSHHSRHRPPANSHHNLPHQVERWSTSSGDKSPESSLHSRFQPDTYVSSGSPNTPPETAEMQTERVSPSRLSQHGASSHRDQLSPSKHRHSLYGANSGGKTFRLPLDEGLDDVKVTPNTLKSKGKADKGRNRKVTDSSKLSTNWGADRDQRVERSAGAITRR